MRYANRLNAFEREAAHAAIRNRIIQPVLPNNGQAQQQQQLINGEIEIAQINEHHLQLQNFDRGLQGLQQQHQVRLNHHDVLDYQPPDELQEQLDEDVQNMLVWVVVKHKPKRSSDNCTTRTRVKSYMVVIMKVKRSSNNSTTRISVKLWVIRRKHSRYLFQCLA